MYWDIVRIMLYIMIPLFPGSINSLSLSYEDTYYLLGLLLSPSQPTSPTLASATTSGLHVPERSAFLDRDIKF